MILLPGALACGRKAVSLDHFNPRFKEHKLELAIREFQCVAVVDCYVGLVDEANRW